MAVTLIKAQTSDHESSKKLHRVKQFTRVIERTRLRSVLIESAKTLIAQTVLSLIESKTLRRLKAFNSGKGRLFNDLTYFL